MNYREPVIGTRDLVSPHGQFTAELYDEDTGKVVHRVVVENTILDASLRVADQRIRNVWNTGTTVATDTDQWWMQLAATPKEGPDYIGIEAQRSWIYLSDSTLAVNAQGWAIPGTILGGVYTPDPYTGSGVRRGANTPIQSTRESTKRRFAVDFTAAQALGTIGSFGLGCLLWNTQLDLLWPMPTYVPGIRDINPISGYTYGGAVTPYSESSLTYFEGFGYSGAPVNLSAKFVADNGSEFWYVLGGIGLFNRNMGASASRPANQAITITGPTYATIGAAVGNAIGMTIIGSDMWLGYATTLKKCAIPTNATLSVTTTYAGVTGFTDAAILDVTSDATNLYLLGSTKVFVVDPATGAVTSSWVHNLTTVQSIEYVAAPVPYLYIAFEVATGSNQSYSTTSTTSNSPRVQSFTTVGAIGPYLFGLPNYDLTGGPISLVSFTGSFAGGWGVITFTGRTSGYGMFRGPQATSRAVLGTPFVKDATKALRVVYDIAYT